MKEFLQTMMKDYRKENFTKSDVMKYGIIYPMIIFMLMAGASLLV